MNAREKVLKARDLFIARFSDCFSVEALELSNLVYCHILKNPKHHEESIMDVFDVLEQDLCKLRGLMKDALKSGGFDKGE